MVYDRFSAQWYSTFLAPIPSERTAVEVDFVFRHLPPGRFRKLLDVCCGPGRHARLLAERGYQVVGIDHNEEAIHAARALEIADAQFHVMDMRELHALDTVDALDPLETQAGDGRARGAFDGVVNLWHSFGYFDDETNEGVVRQIAGLLAPGGRAVFDIYNRDHCVTLPAREVVERDGVTIETTRTWEDKRLTVRLRYAASDAVSEDRFEWRLYTPGEFQELCERAGFACRVVCAWFDESIAVSPEHARMQFVIERRE